MGFSSFASAQETARWGQARVGGDPRCGITQIAPVVAPDCGRGGMLVSSADPPGFQIGRKFALLRPDRLDGGTENLKS